MQSGVSMQEAVVGIAGDHIQSFATRSIISIPHSSREISKTDVLRITEDAKNIKLQADRKYFIFSLKIILLMAKMV